MDIGRYSEKDLGLGFFGKGIICASFHMDGKSQFEIEKLKIWHSIGRIISRIGIIIFRLMQSLPTALERIEVTLFLTSQAVKEVKEKEGKSGVGAVERSFMVPSFAVPSMLHEAAKCLLIESKSKSFGTELCRDFPIPSDLRNFQIFDGSLL